MTGEVQRRKRVPRAERERQMLTVAEQAFAEHGYQAASMDEIADRVGVSKPMLYEYFGSKEGLLLGCIRAARAELLDMTQRAVASAVNVEDALRRGLVAYFQFISEHQQSWSLLRHESSLLAGPAGAEIEATRQQQTNLMTSLMGAQLPNTTTRQREAAAEIIVGACERLATWRERHDDVSNEEAAEYVLQSTWFGLQRLTEPVF